MDQSKSESESELVTFSAPALRKTSRITLEPAVFLLFISFSLSSTILQNQIIYQTCTVQFGYNSTDCLYLGTPNASKEIEMIVQPYASQIFVTRIVVDSVLPGILSLFIGPWSDRFGRKPILISSSIGYFLNFTSLMVVAWISTVRVVNPWWYIATFVPIGLSGGFCSLLTGIFCYITDITTPKNRALRMSLVECALFVGVTIGSLVCSYLLKYTSTHAIFGISSAMALIVILYILLCVEESIQNGEADRRIGKMAKFGALLDTALVADLFSAVFKRRDHFDRAIVWFTLLSLTFSVFVLNGSEAVFYLFVREKFNWSILDSTTYDATTIAFQVFGSIIGLYVLAKLLRLTESTVAVLAYFSAIADYTIKSLATESWQLYMGSGVAMLKSVASPMCRVILTKVVPPNEFGKIFAVTTSLEAMTSLVAAPLYGIIYERTLTFYPGAFNLISAGFFVVCVVLMVSVRLFQRTSQVTISYGPISE